MATAWNETRSGAVMGGAILVVEDEPAIQELIAVNLEHAGHQVLRAANVSEAEALVREVLPDLVLLDWMLPGPPGVNFARQLRADQRTKDIPIIMLTARAQEQDTIVGLESGADDYVTKPFSPRELLARIKAVMRRRAPQLTERTSSRSRTSGSIRSRIASAPPAATSISDRPSSGCCTSS